MDDRPLVASLDSCSPEDDTGSEIAAMKRIRKKMLMHWESLLDAGTISATEMATITRLAVQNGWVLDETRLPSRLKDKLLTHSDPSVIDDDDGVIPIRASGGKQRR